MAEIPDRLDRTIAGAGRLGVQLEIGPRDEDGILTLIAPDGRVAAEYIASDVPRDWLAEDIVELARRLQIEIEA